MRTGGARSVAAVAAIVALAGCSTGGEDEAAPEVVVSAEVPAAPEPTASPAGEVSPAAPIDMLAVSAPGRTLVAVETDRTRLSMLPLDDLAAEPRTVETDSEILDIHTAPDGAVLLALDGAVGTLDPENGEIERIPVDGRVTAVAALDDGRLAVGVAGDDADGGSDIRILGAGGDVEATIGGIASVDDLAVTDGRLTALDRTQTSVTEIVVDEERLGLALRAGEGATELTTDHFGRILVSDTIGHEVLVHTTGDLMLRQRFPTGEAPFAVAYDDVHERVWVSLPGTNEVVGYDLGTGVGVETERFTTVRQPDALAVDPESGSLIVASATGDGVQRIPIGRP
ncbi:hypothetical protein DW322_14695 [Rhodococcus rhodnii]|uniref:Lipoprotein n=1 Tax=Rhodococcus rhodnii TaxID=38312 RepID=A0A6P2CF96_9NOCA|nr:hypothetical protein [Rhodococcus rhodnii]TXG91235.1 hypothetical protein DW322_14695 [Rhodococcus rhodnii]